MKDSVRGKSAPSLEKTAMSAVLRSPALDRSTSKSQPCKLLKPPTSYLQQGWLRTSRWGRPSAAVGKHV